jgi:hypothetical protein
MFILIWSVDNEKSIFSKLVPCTAEQPNKSQCHTQVFQNPFSSFSIYIYISIFPSNPQIYISLCLSVLEKG